MQARPIRLPRQTGPESSQSRPVAAVAPEPPRLARFELASVITQTPEERTLRVDINGCLAGAIRAIPDARRELAVGWAFMHGFFEASDVLGRVTVGDDRVSLMVDGGEDLERLRLEAAGWQAASRLRRVASFPPRPEPLRIGEEELHRLAAEAFRQFRRDGAVAGFVHAGIASARTVHCIARDVHAEAAVAKVLGWVLLENRHAESRALVVRGLVRRDMVRAAARCGIELILSDAIPTSAAVRDASGLPLSIVGMATSRRMGLFVDGGHIV